MPTSVTGEEGGSLVYVRIAHLKGRRLVAICDEGILGKTFREGRLKLEVSEQFYKGSLLPMDEAVKLVVDSDIANLTGRSIVDAILREGLADRRAVITISGIPHLQILRL
ncbi:MAG: DUF424 family protein [Candidatus Bathyarchaeia archaeon]